MKTMKNSDAIQRARQLLEEKRRAHSREQLVVAYIEGVAAVPDDLRALVQRYREYADVRKDCVSFPVHEDERANRIYDALVAMA